MKNEQVTKIATEFILTRAIEELANLTNEKVAKSIGVNSIYLSRNFKKDQKISVDDFILREKLYRAYFILSKNFFISIDALSSELGFSKVEDFNIKFEKFFAVKPKDLMDIRRKSA